MASQQVSSEPASQIEHCIHIALLAVWLPQKGWLLPAFSGGESPAPPPLPLSPEVASKLRNSLNFDLACWLPAAQLSSEKAQTARESEDNRSERER
jgi:hypothetical protein